MLFFRWTLNESPLGGKFSATDTRSHAKRDAGYECLYVKE